MKKILIVGDSQSVNPGAAAERKLKALGYETKRVSNVGMGPYDYVRIADLWKQYTSAVDTFHPDLIILIFGSNDAPNKNLKEALTKLKNNVKPKVILTGPPRYPDPEHQALGEKIRVVYAGVFTTSYFDSYPYTDPKLSRAADGLHLTVSGAATWGAAIAVEVTRRTPIGTPSPAPQSGAPR